MSVKGGVRLKIISSIYQNFPKEARITKIEFEGPEIAVYVENPSAVGQEVVKKVAKEIKKRIIIKASEKARKSEKEALEIIKAVVPPEAKIVDVRFDEELGEVLIKAKKPGLVIGKGGTVQQKIFAETGWRAVIVREPPIKSRTIDNVLGFLYSETEDRANNLRLFGERIHRDVIYKSGDLRIVGLGAFQEVGRSAVLVETPESKVLLDVGLNPSETWGPDFFPRLDLDLKVEELDAVVVTHAHLDHCGMVPYLFKYGYNGPVYVTEPTRDIMALMQLDSLDIAEKEGRPLPYSAKEVRSQLTHTITLDYGEVTDVAPDVKITLYNAGHILGSAMVHLYIGDGKYNILYTGDFKYARTRLLDRAADEINAPRLDAVIMETTYGASDQQSRDEAEATLMETITKTVNRGGKVLIPVLAVGRGQEIMLVINDLMRRKLIPEVPVYITGMVDEITNIHNAYPEMLSRELRDEILRKDENPFLSEYFHRIEGYREDIAQGEPSIIIATSGMLNGGPAVEFFKNMAPDPRNTIIFVSYQAEGTLGRKVRDGATEVQLLNREGKVETVKVAMERVAIEGFSGHSDRRQLLNFITNLTPRPKKLVLNHGERGAIASFMRLIEREKVKRGFPRLDVIAPEIGEAIKVT